MKKILAIVLMMALMLMILCSCGNKDLFDTNYTFDTAIIGMPDGTSRTIAIKNWTDYDDGEQIQITATDGTVYLVSSYNCVLVNK